MKESMDAARWKQIDEVFSAALDLEPEKRAAFLDEACAGDEELRKEVESLLASDEQEQNRIEQYPMDMAADLLAEQRAVFAPGNSIGPYKILSLLGSGGMAEVYRASDSRIGREVAVKILPAQFSQDPDRLRRFEQEAHAAGMLNHANIVAIYDSGTNNGSPYLVSELLQGEVLQEKLDGHPLPVRKAVDYALQIASGLSAAHKEGIVHRDLKPGNIFITKDGRVKILDFGIAKLTHPDGSAAAAENIDLTDTGIVVGTILYMSPEQVTGRKVDRRSDIFAFGSVLYEMLSGKRPFTGETRIEIMHSILKTDPPEFAGGKESVPPALDRIVRRCLEKDPDRRFQSANDLAFALESMSSISQTDALSLRQKKPRQFAWMLSFLFLIAAVAFGVAYYRESRKTVPEIATSIQRLSIVMPENTVLNSSAISPDGKRIAYVTNATTGFSKLWLRSLDSKEAEEIPGGESATLPFWSPDSKSIAFFTERELKTLTIGGGPPRILYDGPMEIAKGGTWNQYGDILFSPRSGEGLHRIPARGGESTFATTLDSSRAEVRHLFPQFLPDGRHFLYLVRSPRGDAKAVYLGSLDSKDRKLILPELTPVRFVDPGYLFFVRNRKLMVQRFDQARYELAGEALAISDNTSTHISGPNFSISRNNILIDASDDRWASQPTWFDRSGKRSNPVKNSRPAVAAPGHYQFCSLSPDGSRLLTFWNEVFWMLDLSSGEFSRYAITNETNAVLTPSDAVFSPDGTRVAYAAYGKDPFDVSLYMRASNGSGKAELLHHASVGIGDLAWSRDGRFVTFTGVTAEAKTLFDLWALPVQEKREPFRLLQTPVREECAALSPDGKWVAYQSYDSGLPEIFVRSFPSEEGGVWPISTGGGEMPAWRQDGKELFYLTLDKKLMGAEIQTDGTFKPGVPRVLFQTHAQPRMNPWGIGSTKQYFVSSDGNHFLINTLIDKTTPAEINVLLNWQSLLNR